MLRTIYICKTCRIIYACSIDGVKTDCKDCKTITDNCWIETTTFPMQKSEQWCPKHLDEHIAEEKSRKWRLQRVLDLMV